MLLTSWLASVKNSVVRSLASRSMTKSRRANAMRGRMTPGRVEHLEGRQLLAFDFVAALKSPVGNDFVQRGQTLTEAPQEITLRFSPGTVLNQSTVAGNIQVLRSGGFNDAIGTAGSQADVLVPIGYVGVKDTPNQNEIVLRFAEPLLDDAYRIVMSTGLSASSGAQPNTLLAAQNFDFKLDLGAKIQAVVPQPITGSRTITIADPALLTDGDLLTVDLDGVQTVFEFDRDGQAAPNRVRVDLNAPANSTAAGIAATIAPLIPTQGGIFSVTLAGADITLASTIGSAPRMTFVPNSAGVVVVTSTTPSNRTISFGNILDITDGDTLRVQVGLQVRTLEFDRTGAVSGSNTRIQLPATNGNGDRILLATRVAVALNGFAGISTAFLGPVIPDQVRLVQSATTAIATTFTLSTTGTIASTTASTQARDTVAVYFNVNDPLNPASAQTPTFYTLVDTQSGATLNPASVVYNAARGVAVLKFAAALNDNRTFRLQVGTFTAPVADVVVAATETNVVTDNADSSFAGSQNLGTLGTAKQVVSGSISPKNPTGTLLVPGQPGGQDEPGHRDIPYESHGIGSSSPGTATNTAVVQYYFPTIYGTDVTTGLPLSNAITPEQKQMARMIYEIYAKAHGLRAVETANSGTGIVTGDIRAVAPNFPPDSIGGIAGGGLAVMNASSLGSSNNVGGGWWGTALHEIGHTLGLGHAYDLPSVMGQGPNGSAVDGEVYPFPYDDVHLEAIYPKNGADIDTYKFAVATNGKLKINTVAALRAAGATGLDTVLTLYRETGSGASAVRTLVARNDDYNNTDSQIELELNDITTPTTFYVVVTSQGNTQFNPEVANSGYGGRTDGNYRLDVQFTNAAATTNIKDAQNTDVDGDNDGKAGGLYNFWFQTAAASVTDPNSRTYFVDKSYFAGFVNGNLATPFPTIQEALNAANLAKLGGVQNVLVRILGNGGTDGNFGTPADALPYLIGTDLNSGAPLADGAKFDIPAGVTVMIDQDAVIKIRAENLEVGSSSGLASRAGAALQVLGTPGRSVYFTSFHNDTLGGNSDGTGPSLDGGQWGGLVFRGDSDSTIVEAATGIKTFLSSVNGANITYGGGQVSVIGLPAPFAFAPIHLDSSRFDGQPVSGTRPAITNNRIELNAGPGISADPNSFDDRLGRIGPDVRGNLLFNNTTNGLFLRISTPLGGNPNQLDVTARFKSTDITYVIAENLILTGGTGGLDATSGVARARPTGRLVVDPGVVVKLSSARIEMDRGPSQLIAEGLANKPVVFTALSDPRFGAGGTYNTNGNQPDIDPTTGTITDQTGTRSAAGTWGGFNFMQASSGSIDNAYIAFGGGRTAIEGDFDNFNTVEIRQAKVRIANSRFDTNANGQATGNRNSRGTNASTTIFVSGAQPTILANDFLNNRGSAISINANSMVYTPQPDIGRTTGLAARRTEYDNNFGPLLRANRFSVNTAVVPAGNTHSGVSIRAEEIVTESVWDDTDIVHILQGQIFVGNLHTATGLRLQSNPTESLVVKLSGGNAGFLATGTPGDIDDRIGGTVQVVGQPGFPVVLTDLRDDTVGASFDLRGLPTKDTNNDGTATTPVAGGWRGLQFERFSNDRNVAVYNEREVGLGGVERNATTSNAEILGTLAPNVVNAVGITSTDLQEAIREKGGDDNRRLGFEVHGYISADRPNDVDLYKLSAYAGSEVWLDIDKSSSQLDTIIELLDATGTVRATSDSSQAPATNSGPALANSKDTVLLAGANGDLQRDTYRGGDYYTTNPYDAGMRVVLPGVSGTLDTYFVRVRSRGTTAAPASSGLTSGHYELRIRVNQRDDKPGSTVQFADIRYAVNGIQAIGLPGHSPLVAESGEANDAANFTTAQDLGNLLQTDRNTVTVSGSLSSPTDVDWYSFSLAVDLIQSIGGVNGGGKTWSTVFDIDYADGIARPDTTVSVFDSTGRLILVARDGQILDDQSAAGQGADFDDMRRGSNGALDPFIGPAQMPTGVPSAVGSTATYPNGTITNQPDRNSLFRYYVAVSSQRGLPSALNATFNATATNSLIRMEPINSIRRVVEDHIGFGGYTSGGVVTPVVPQIIDMSTSTALQANVKPFTLEDVKLYISSGNSLSVYNPFTGRQEVGYTTGLGTDIQDLDMRPDGRLYSYRNGTGGTANQAGILGELSMATGAELFSQGDAIPNQPTTGTVPNYTITTDQVDALAFRLGGGNGVGVYDELYFSVRAGSGSRLYRAASGGTSSTNPDPTANQTRADANRGFLGTIRFETSVGAGTFVTNRVMTGLQFRQDVSGGPGTLYGVDNLGNYYSISRGFKPGNPPDPEEDDPFFADATMLASFGTQVIATPGGNVTVGGFEGLAAAPQNLEDARFRGMFFAVTAAGRLVVIDPATNTLRTELNFDTNSDGIGDAAISRVLTSGATGLAFTPVDINAWHPTERRFNDAGHGINTPFDNTRTPGANDITLNSEAEGRDSTEALGGASMYFGVENYVDDPEAANAYFQYDTNGQFGAMSGGFYNWQQQLTANPNIRGNYNAPGGAYGSLTTGSFSLAGYTANNLPSVYFNYFLSTQNANSKSSAMRDSARVLISSDNGVTWDLLATNNSVASALGTADGELPAFQSVSRNISSTANQRVQELFDNTGGWRQARVDLADFAGQANLMLRFDFTTAGELDPSARRDLDGNGTTELLNNIQGNIFGDFNDQSRGANNDSEGFYIDDIIVGFAERGEMVTGAQAGQVDFFQTALPTDPSVPTKQLTGEYTLSIRRGTEYAAPLDPAMPELSIFGQYDPDDRFVEFPAPVTSGVTFQQLFSAATTVGTGGGNNVNTTSPVIIATNGNVQVSTTVTTPAYIPPGVPVGDTDESVTEILPFEGTHALYMDALDPNNPAGAAFGFPQVVGVSYATLSLGNLTGINSAFLSFAYNNLRTPVTALPTSFTDPNLGIGVPAFGTGLAISENGTDWVSIFTPAITLGAWRTAAIDLVAAVRNAGFTNLANIRMRIQVGTVQVPQIGSIPAQDGTFATGSGIAWDAFRVAVTPAIGSTGSIGDQNPIRDQGQLILANNIIRNSQNTGIDIQAAPRDNATSIARPGSPIALPTLNGSRLAPGVVIVNNVVTEGAIGINFQGDAGGANLPPAVVPYGRIVNNTIVSATTGIRVANNAGPTILNNLFSGAATATRSGMTTGISVDGSSAANTVTDINIYHGVGATGVAVDPNKDIVVALSQPMFVNPVGGNFYLASGSAAIDSSINVLPDRPAITTVLSPLQIPVSPILAPDFDVYGQLRKDDLNQGDFGGIGSNIFKDRGAIDRVDTNQPTFKFVELATTDTTPGFETRLDSITTWGGDPRLDRDINVDALSIQDKTAAQVTEFRFRLADIGVGIDKSTVVSSAFVINRTNLIGNVSTLVAGTDYTFIYNENTNEVKFVAPATWKPGTYQIVVTSRPTTPSQAGFLTDLANNTLLANKSNGTISFDIALKLEDPTVNQPADVTIFEDQGTPDTDNGNGTGHVPTTLAGPTVTDTSVLLIPITGISAGGKANNAPGAPGYNNLENQPIRVTAVSSDPNVLLLAQLTYPEPSTDPTRALLQVAPIPNLPLAAPTTVTITVTVTDAGFDGVFNASTDPEFDDQTVVTLFTVTINPRNDLPTQDTVTSVTYNGIIPADRRLNVTGITAGGGESQTLRVTALSGNTVILADPTVVYTSPNNTAELRFFPGLGTPAFGVAGTVPVAVTVRDAGLDGMLDTPDDGVRLQIFNVSFFPNNTLPTIDPVNPINHVGWVGPQTVNLTNISTGAGDLQALRAQMTFSAPPNFFVNTPTLLYTPNNPSGTVTYTPRGDVTGTATITVTIFDNGVDLVPGNADDGFIVRTFDINIVAFNDAPVANNDTVPAGSNAAPLEDAVITMPISQLLGNDTVATTAPYLTTEPQTPPGQVLILESVQNAVGGTVRIDGSNVIFTPDADFNGTASFTYTVRDNGTNNGLNDFKRSTATVSITYTPVNDAPRRTTGPASNTINVRQDQFQGALGFSNLVYSPGPADEAGQTLMYQVLQIPADSLGVLTLADGRTRVGVGSSLTLTQLQGLQFRPNGLSFGQGTLQLQVRDNGGTDNGGIDTLIENFTINVTPLDPANLQKLRFIRSYNPNADYHFFTTNTAEFNNAMAGGYLDETTDRPGFSLSMNPVPGGLAIYRLYNVQTGRHYYTTSAGERDFLANIIPVGHPEFGKVGWRYELDEPFVYPTQQPGTTEIFRLYNVNSGVHLYTENAGQKDAILAQFPGIWVQHSSLGFAFFDPARSFIPNGPVFATAASSTTSAAATSAAATSATSTEAIDKLVRTVDAVPGQSSRSSAPAAAPATVAAASAPIGGTTSEPETSDIDSFWSTVGGSLMGGTDVALEDFE
jgi:hypothetical protein